MATVTKNLRDAVLKIQDATPTTPNEVTVAIEQGDLKWTEEHPIIEVLDRGVLDHVRTGDEVSVKGSFSVKFCQFLKQTSETVPGVYEALTRKGSATGWVSTNTAACTYACKLEFTINDCVTANQDEKIVFAKVFVTKISFEEGDPDKLSFDFVDFETAPTISKT